MTTRNDRIEDCHPATRKHFLRLAEMLEQDYRAGTTRTLFLVFETYRSPERQAEADASGVMAAKAWKSAHQWGFAVDFVPWDEQDGWNWNEDADWDHLHARAKFCGLSTLPGDRPHIQHPLWHTAKAALQRK